MIFIDEIELTYLNNNKKGMENHVIEIDYIVWKTSSNMTKAIDHN